MITLLISLGVTIMAFIAVAVYSLKYPDKELELPIQGLIYLSMFEILFIFGWLIYKITEL